MGIFSWKSGSSVSDSQSKIVWVYYICAGALGALAVCLMCYGYAKVFPFILLLGRN